MPSDDSGWRRRLDIDLGFEREHLRGVVFALADIEYSLFASRAVLAFDLPNRGVVAFVGVGQIARACQEFSLAAFGTFHGHLGA